MFFFSRTPDTESLPVPIPSTPSPQSSVAITNSYNKQLSQSLNNSTSGKSSLTVGLSTQTQNKNSKYRQKNLLNKLKFLIDIVLLVLFHRMKL